MNGHPQLEARGVTVRFGGLTAVDNVDAAFAARLGEAAARVVRLRARITPRIVPAAELAALWHRPSRGALLARLASLQGPPAGVDPTERT